MAGLLKNSSRTPLQLATNIHDGVNTVNVERNSNPSRTSQASSPSWPIKAFADRDDWLKLLLAVDSDALSSSAKVVAIRIALHHNVESGQCNPTIGRLALGTGMSESTVRRMIRELEEAGWLGVDRTRGRHSNSFDLRAPTLSHAKGLNPVNGDSVEGSNPSNCGRVQAGPTLSNEHSQPCQIEANPVTADTQKRESITAKGKANEIDTLEFELGRRGCGRRERSHSETEDDDFETWYRQYPKRVAKAAALKAYRAVVTKKLATPDELLAGAMRYAAERSDQDPRYTKHPATWLNGGCWADEPVKSITGTIDSDANGLAAPPPNRTIPPQWGRRESNTERLMRKLREGV